MHIWVLFLWLSGKIVTINTQEFNSRADCLKAGIVLKHAIGDEITFACMDKGK